MASEAVPLPENDVFELLKAQHREVEDLFAEYRAESNPAQRRRIADVIVALLVRHAVAEEEHIYPLACRLLPDGERLARHDIREHAEAELTLRKIDQCRDDPVQEAALVAALEQEITHHVRAEERLFFPKLRAHCTVEDTERLARRVRRAGHLAPTRPHPNAPDTPPWNRVLAPGTGLVDRIKDGFTGRSSDPEDLTRPLPGSGATLRPPGREPRGPWD